MAAASVLADINYVLYIRVKMFMYKYSGIGALVVDASLFSTHAARGVRLHGKSTATGALASSHPQHRFAFRVW